MRNVTRILTVLALSLVLAFVNGPQVRAQIAMLTESFDFQGLAAVFNGLLGPFFEDARFNAVAVFKSGEANHLLLFHAQTPQETAGFGSRAQSHVACVLDDVFYLKALGGISIIYGQSVRHAYRKRSRTSKGSDDLPEFGIEG